jgi:hypothetical protein
MDIPTCASGSGDFTNVAKYLSTGGSSDQIYGAIKDASGFSDKANSRGLRVLRAAVGFKDDNRNQNP